MSYSSIEEFSRDLFFHYVYFTDFPLPQEESTPLESPNLIKTVCEALGHFCDGFSNDFLPTFVKCASRVRSTDEQLLTYVVPRFLKLCEKPTYFHFMLACAFTTELIHHFARKRKCYRFTGTAYKCLVVAFDRGFDKLFEALGGWGGLVSFCEGHNTVLSLERHESVQNFLIEASLQSKKEVMSLIAECDDLEDEDLCLTGSELSLAYRENFSAIDTTFNASFITSDTASFQFEWNFKTATQTIFLTTHVDFETVGAYSTTIQHVANTPPSEDAPTGEPQSEESFESVDSDDSLRTQSFKEKLDATNFSHFVGVVFHAEKSEPLSDCSRSSSDMECDGSDSKVLPDLQEIIVASSKHYALTREPTKFYSCLSARVCMWCDKKCYSYARYFFKKHRELALRPTRTEPF